MDNPTMCMRCGSDDLYDHGHRLECIDCEAGMWFDGHDWQSWSGSTARAAQAAQNDVVDVFDSERPEP